MSFYKEINSKILSSLKNNYYENFDFEIRDLPKIQREKIEFEKNYNNTNNLHLCALEENFFWDNIKEYEYFYNLLADQDSRNKFIEILAYKVLGFLKVKLSLNCKSFWNMRKATANYIKKDKINLKNFNQKKLSRYALHELGYDLDIYFSPNGIVVAFMMEQYAYKNKVQVKHGDVVIDCGGCWGDTALYFISKGASKVYTFEFVSSNIEIMNKNLALNSNYKDKVKLIMNPTWDSSNAKLSYIDLGPSSMVGNYDTYEKKIETLSIDDLIIQNKIEKVDFIKMDIEGAEIPALNGARDTIIKFKPKLAISVYHKPDDMIKIPKLISSIRGDYKFYFDYYTIIGDEVVLYAI